MVEKTRLTIGFPTVIFFCSLLFLGLGTIALLPFVAALLHEFGHIAVMKLCGIKITQIKILPFGVDIKKEEKVTSYKTDILISSSGIAVNILLVLLSLFFPECAERIFFIASNVTLAALNSLPIKSLDGGQILEKIITLKYDLPTAEKAVGISSLISIIMLGAIAVWVLFNTSYNFTLLFMCIYLFIGVFIK